jgi:hypothetical protein
VSGAYPREGVGAPVGRPALANKGDGWSIACPLDPTSPWAAYYPWSRGTGIGRGLGSLQEAKDWLRRKGAPNVV